MSAASRPELTLMEGSEAIARAAIAADCRFFAGYPMTPFTELLEHFARLLPRAGGVCINAESELEAVGMAWGALATGARAATGSTGQGCSLMQESFAEMALAELPLVAFNMARGQGDYHQATRGGGHGDYRHIVLAPLDIAEAVDLTQLAFFLADKWRNPVLVIGDYLLAHTREAVAIEALELPDLPSKDWALDGSANGTGRSGAVTPLGVAKGQDSFGQDSFGQEAKFQRIATKLDVIETHEARVETAFLDDAQTVVVAYGSPAKFVRHAVGQLRDAGHAVGWIRPITLWPFPHDAVREAAGQARRLCSFEISGGQMIDDVRIAAAGQCAVEFIGGVSTDGSGFGVGRLHDVGRVRDRILAAHLGEPLPPVPGYETARFEPAPHQLEATP